MKTIEDIKEGITSDFMRNEDVARKYNFTVGDTFSSHFSKASIENVLFYVFAAAAWVLERLFAQHKEEVDKRIDEILPHRAKWYRNIVLKFLKDKVLIPGTDRYDTTDMTDDKINELRVVKHAVATERKDSSILTIKVAGADGDNKRCKLPKEVEEQLFQYISEVKDAGVRINLVNVDADIFNCTIDVYYDPMLLSENVQAECLKSIEGYIGNLPFNGEYTNMELIDILQKVQGVKIVEYKNATTRSSSSSVELDVDARCVPDAGYFIAGDIIINMEVYE